MIHANGVVFINNSIFDSNSFPFMGDNAFVSVIYVAKYARIENCTFINNTIPVSDQVFDYIFCTVFFGLFSQMELFNCTIESNILFDFTMLLHGEGMNFIGSQIKFVNNYYQPSLPDHSSLPLMQCSFCSISIDSSFFSNNSYLFLTDNGILSLTNSILENHYLTVSRYGELTLIDHSFGTLIFTNLTIDQKNSDIAQPGPLLHYFNLKKIMAANITDVTINNIHFQVGAVILFSGTPAFIDGLSIQNCSFLTSGTLMKVHNYDGTLILTNIQLIGINSNLVYLLLIKVLDSKANLNISNSTFLASVSNSLLKISGVKQIALSDNLFSINNLASNIIPLWSLYLFRLQLTNIKLPIHKLKSNSRSLRS